MKFLIGLVMFTLSLVSGVIAFQHSKRKQLSTRPLDFAIMIAAITLGVCIAVIVGLAQIGWYPD